ncbi:MAG: DUF748 domain-containing protein [Xanthomonadales bacterium]|nr:DUF748 domain-containing protein [Xanthomonadales bacterium]
MTDSTESRPTALPGWLQPWLDYRRKRCWLLIALVTYTLLGFLVAPWAVERVLTGQMEAVGRSLTIEETRTNPYLLTLEMTGFELRDTDSEPLIAYDRLFVDFETRSLIDWALNFKRIELDQLYLFEERFEGTDTRLVRFLADLAPAEEASAEAEEDLPPRAIVQELRVRDASVRVIDGPADRFTYTLGPITVDVDDVRTLPDHAGQQAVSILLNETDSLSWRGDIQIVPFRSDGEIVFRGNAMPNIRPYLDYYLPLDIDFSGVDLDVSYHTRITEAGLDLVLENIRGDVRDLALLTDDTNEELIRVERTEWAGGTFDLLSRSARLAAIDVTDFDAEIVLREDGSMNLLDLLPAAGTEDPEAIAPPGAAEDTWSAAIDRFTVADSGFSVEDRTVEPALTAEIQGLALEIEGIDLEDGSEFPLAVNARLESGGDLAFQGAVTAFPELTATGRIDITGLAIPLAQPYVNALANVDLAGGTLDLTADIRHGPDQLLEAAGNLQLTDLDVVDRGREERLVSWTALTLDRFEADLSAERIETSTAQLQGLYGRFHIAEDLTTNVSDVLVTDEDPGEAGDAAGSEDGAPLPDITVGGVRLDDAALDFSDASLPLPFAAAIRDMDGDISTLATRSREPASVDLEGQVNEFGQARINGTINAWDPVRQTDIDVVFRNLEISRLSPYSVQFAGYEIAAGRLDADLGYVVQEGQLAGENGVVIREIELGEKIDHPDAGSLPLGLAIALLKDSEGVIDLDVPVEGDLNNPEFRIGGVIMQVLGNLITRAVTAPFRLLGSLVGIESEDFGIIAFEPGSAEISPPDREKLLKLAEAMQQRPELALEIPGVWSETVDAQALREQAVDERIAAWETANPDTGGELSTERDRAALEALHQEEFPQTDLAQIAATHEAPPPDDPEGDVVFDETAYLADLRKRLIDSVDVGLAEFEALARARSAAVAEALAAHAETPAIGAGAEADGDTLPPPTEGSAELALAVMQVEPKAVEPGDDGTVQLELAVSVAE